MTYRELLNGLLRMDDKQLDCTLTVEDGTENECWAAELRFAHKHDSLEDYHPVIYFRQTVE